MYPCRLLIWSHTNQAGHCVVAQQLLQRAAWVIPFYYLIPLYLLPVYRYGSLLSIDTRMSTFDLHMTSLDVIKSAHPCKFGCIKNIHEN